MAYVGMNPTLILKPLGMIIVSFLSIWMWKSRKHVEAKFFLLKRIDLSYSYDFKSRHGFHDNFEAMELG